MSKPMDAAHLKGMIFEIVVLRLVLMSGYHLIPSIYFDNTRIKCSRRRFLEFAGRGGFHQIDIPCDADYTPLFMYPIRLLGECKYYKDPISKSLIRSEIGIMKDIQENYFSNNCLTDDMKEQRRTEIFAFFSATGFNIEAEKLAYAHNIQTISFEDNLMLKDIVRKIDEVADFVSHFSKEVQTKFLDALFAVLIYDLDRGRYPEIDTLDNCSNLNETKNLKEAVSLVKTSIIGRTKSGISLMFTSNFEFPDNLFSQNDNAKCRISSINGTNWFLHFKNSNCRLYFSMPKVILDSYFETENGNVVYQKKEKIFEEISIERVIDGKKRYLTLTFDERWFDSL